MSELVRQLMRVGRFNAVPAYQRVAYSCGALLILSGLFHGVVYIVNGGPWEGPISWRKPIVFGLSFGITLVTLAWMLGFLRPRKVAAWVVVGVLVVASIGEVALISMQKWRGVASHFNEDTAFDAMVFSMMGLLVSLLVVVTVLITVWSFFRLDAPASLALAIRAGLVTMLVGQMVGVQMIVVGGNTFGADGALKVPHALTLHAVQVLPALSLLLLLSDSDERHRVRVVALGTIGYAVLIASTMVQTYAGRAPLDLGVVVILLALSGLTLLAASGLIAIRELASTLHRLPEPTPET
jgi:hypothetical protein